MPKLPTDPPHTMPPTQETPIMGRPVRLLKDLSQGTRVGRQGSVWFATDLRPGFYNLYHAENDGARFTLTGALIMSVAEKDVYPTGETPVCLMWPKA